MTHQLKEFSSVVRVLHLNIHPFISSKSSSTLDVYTTTHTMRSLHSYITVVTAAALLPINTLALLSSSTTTTKIIRQTSLSTIGSRSPHAPSSLPSFTVLESTIETTETDKTLDLTGKNNGSSSKNLSPFLQDMVDERELIFSSSGCLNLRFAFCKYFANFIYLYL